jgi:hypothetical protein
MSACRCQTHHDPGPTFQPRDASAPARSGCGCSYRDRHCHAGPRNKAPNPIFSDCSKAQSPGPNPPNYRPECPDVFSSRVPEAFNAHRQDSRGSGLVQDVLRSPARIPAAESPRRGLCATPANVKRSAFSRIALAPPCRYATSCLDWHLASGPRTARRSMVWRQNPACRYRGRPG